MAGLYDTEERIETKPGEDTAVDCSGMYLLPGFIDIHTHGDGSIETVGQHKRMVFYG